MKDDNQKPNSPETVSGTIQEKNKRRFVLGLVGAPFGLKGFVKVKPFSGETEHFSRLGKVILKKDEKEESREIAEIQRREVSPGTAPVLLVRFAGIENPEDAGELKGAEIIAGREFGAPLREGEYYVEDLKGLEVVSGEKKTLGRVINVVEGGGGDLAEVALPSGETRFVPFRNEFFGDVDLEKGVIALLEPWILDQ